MKKRELLLADRISSSTVNSALTGLVWLFSCAKAVNQLGVLQAVRGRNSFCDAKGKWMFVFTGQNRSVGTSEILDTGNNYIETSG